MKIFQFDPHEEKDRLFNAISTLHEQWGTPSMPQAYRALHRATERAECALAVLEPEEDAHGITFSVHVSGLRILLICAHAEVSRAEAYVSDQLRGGLL